MYKCDSEARARNHCFRAKAGSTTYSECVSSVSYAACKAHAPCYRVICVACPALPYFFTLYHKRQNFQKKSY
jgi:hypothetical protein